MEAIGACAAIRFCVISVVMRPSIKRTFDGAEPRRAVSTARARVGDSRTTEKVVFKSSGPLRSTKGDSDSDASAEMPTAPYQFGRFEE